MAQARPDPGVRRRGSRTRACSRRARPRSSTRRRSSASTRPCAFADKSDVPAARVALRPHLRARRPGQGWYSVDERSAGVHRARTSASSPRPSAGRPTPTTRRSSRPARGRRREGADEAQAEDDDAEEAEATDGRHALPRGAQPGAARGDAARRARLPHGRGHRRLQRRVQGHRTGCSRSSARSACATRRSPRTRSSAWASAPR